MREIKFRAVLKGVERKIYEVLSIDYTTDTIILWDGVEDDLISETIECNFKDIILLQYTGLKDKNGVEIYDGYIVKFDASSPLHTREDGETGVVEFRLACFAVYTSGSKVDFLDELGDWIVIGNIYENPELLEVSNGN